MILPSPKQSLLAMIGPSVLFVSLSLSGGELLLWPDLVSRYGLTIMWFVPLVLCLQYAVNIEIERYTAVTGNNMVSGLVKIVPLFKYLFPIIIAVSLMWPAWISTAGNAIAYGLGFGDYGAWVSVWMLGSLLFVWKSKKSYATIERIAKAGLLIVLGVVAYAVYRTFSTDLIVQSVQTGSWFPQSKDSIAFIAALAYGGVAGVLNLVQSDWIMSRGYGAAGVSQPDTIDWKDPQTKRHWRQWWKQIQTEHALLFIIGNIIGIGLLATLAVLLLSGESVKGFGVITKEITALNAIAPYSGIVFSIGVCFVFLMAQMTILDAAGRLLKRCMTTTKTHEQLSIYVGYIGLAILIASATIPSFNQPASLLYISAVISAGVMAIYPPLIIKLNKTLPSHTRPTWSVPFVYACALFYGAVVLWGIYTSIM